MHAEYEKTQSPFTISEASLASTSPDPEVRLLGEYWEVRLRIQTLSNLMAVSPDKRKRMGLAPIPLMIEQIKGMKKYANALAVRLEYTQGGLASEETVAKAREYLAASAPRKAEGEGGEDA